MRRVHLEKLDRHVILGGCRLPRHSVGLRLAKYLKALAPSPGKAGSAPPPGAIAWNNDQAMTVIANIEGNDQYGDCVEAEDAHYVALMTANGKGLFAYTPALTLARYTALTGFNPQDPTTDNGTDPIQDLNYSIQNPYADGTCDAGYLLVDATNKTEIESALAIFGNLKMWLALPDSYLQISGNGFVWAKDTPNPQNGHCVGACGYIDTGAPPSSLQVLGVTAQGLAVMTWGMVGTLTWDAVAALCTDANNGGLAVRVTQDWLNQAGQSPTGLDYATLVQDFDAIGGNVPSPSPAPPAPPGPAPSPPAGGVTLAQAQSWAAAGLQAAWPPSSSVK